MTIWKKINFEYVKMISAKDLPVNDIQNEFNKAFVETNISLMRNVPDILVMGQDNTSARDNCILYATKTDGEFSMEDPGWFFIASAHEYVPLGSLVSEILYPSSGTAGPAISLIDKISLPSNIDSGTPNYTFIFNSELSKYVAFQITSFTPSLLNLEIKDYYEPTASTSMPFLNANLNDYYFPENSTIQIQVRSPGSFGIGGISPNFAGRSIVFTKYFGRRMGSDSTFSHLFN